MKLKQLVLESEGVDFPNDYALTRHLKTKYDAYPNHVKEWIRSQLNKVSNPYHLEASIFDAADYYLDKIKDNRFQNILSQITPSPKNILTLNLDDIKNAQEKFDSVYNTPSKRSIKKLNKGKHVSELVNDDKLRILRIDINDDVDGAAAILSDIARGTKWCVTDKKIAVDHLKQGPIFVVFDKGANAKFLCHPVSYQFMNVRDEPFTTSDDRVFSLLIKYIDDIGFIYEGDNPELMIYNPESAYIYAFTKGERWLEAEPYIMKSPEYAYKYAANILNERWLEAEKYIINSEFNVPYAKDVIGSRWSEAEPYILSMNTGDIISYAAEVVGGRWEEAEPIILRYPGGVRAGLIVSYSKEVIKGRWPQGEKVLLNYAQINSDQSITGFANRRIIKKNNIIPMLYWLRIYAMYVIGDRWPEAEEVFEKYPDNTNVKNYKEWVVKDEELRSIQMDSDYSKLFL